VTVADESLADLIGLDARDPGLTSALEALGFERDLVAVIEREQDAPDSSGEGGGSASLKAPGRALRLTFVQEGDGSWFLYEIAYLRGRPEQPEELEHPVLPLGVAFGQTAAEVIARVGEPTATAALGAQRWERGDVAVVLAYDRGGGVKRVHCLMSDPALLARR
jgi:hypothetical protein